MSGNDKAFTLARRGGGGLAYLQSPLLDAAGMAEHAFSTRLGGCSGGAMATLNTAFHTGDERANVLENRRRFLEPWGISPRELVAGIQVHGTAVARVTARERGRGARPGSFLGEYDALVTAEPGVVLTAYAADCLLLFLLAPQVPAAALAHAGWRGTLKDMAGTAVGYLRDNYKADPGRILAAISPGICARCYRVSEAVAEDFRRAGWNGTPYLQAAGSGEYHLDLAAINAAQLLRAGIIESNLARNDWCTACRPDLFYSYRRDKGVTGRMMGFIVLRPPGRAVRR